MPLPKTFGYGNKGEQFVQELFQKAGISCEKNSSVDTRLEHDLQCKIGRAQFTCEVKFDVMAQHTGNIAIEYHNTKKDAPSGLNATKANIWAHLIYDGENKVVYITSVAKLRDYCDKNTPKRIVKNAGDKNANLLLFGCDDILPSIFHRIENIKIELVSKIVKDLLKYEKINTNHGSIVVGDKSASGTTSSV